MKNSLAAVCQRGNYAYLSWPPIKMIKKLTVGLINEKNAKKQPKKRTVHSVYRVAQKTGPAYLIANILKLHDRIAWKLVNFCNITSVYAEHSHYLFLFKNFIALWRHLAKT